MHQFCISPFHDSLIHCVGDKGPIEKLWEGEIYALSEVFSNSIFQFCKRKYFKDEDELVVFANVRVVLPHLSWSVAHSCFPEVF